MIPLVITMWVSYLYYVVVPPLGEGSSRWVRSTSPTPRNMEYYMIVWKGKRARAQGPSHMFHCYHVTINDGCREEWVCGTMPMPDPQCHYSDMTNSGGSEGAWPLDHALWSHWLPYDWPRGRRKRAQPYWRTWQFNNLHNNQQVSWLVPPSVSVKFSCESMTKLNFFPNFDRGENLQNS